MTNERDVCSRPKADVLWPSTRLPARAQRQVTPGEYTVEPEAVRVEIRGGHNARITDLACVLIAAGAQEGTLVQLLIQPESRTIAYEFLEAASDP